MLTSEQVRAARAMLRWEQKDLAEASGVSLPSIRRLEVQPGPLAAQGRTIEAIRAAFEAAGIEFIGENGGGAGLRLKQRKSSMNIQNENYLHYYRSELRKHGFTIRKRGDGAFEIYSGDYVSYIASGIEDLESFTNKAGEVRKGIQEKILKTKS